MRRSKGEKKYDNTVLFSVSVSFYLVQYFIEGAKALYRGYSSIILK